MMINEHDLRRANAAPPLGQARLHSWLEAITGTVIGLVVSLLVQQFIITPLFHLRTNPGENFLIVLIFTIISVLRSFYVRRLFNWWHCWKNGMIG